MIRSLIFASLLQLREAVSPSSVGTERQQRRLFVIQDANKEDSSIHQETVQSKETSVASGSLKFVNAGWQESARPGHARSTSGSMEEQAQDVSAATVLGLTALMAAASGLGAVPFFFVGTLSARWSALANAVACGVMLAASFDLVHEGEPYGPGLVILGVLFGKIQPISCMCQYRRLYSLLLLFYRTTV